MTLKNIDEHNGPLTELIGMMNELIMTARGKRDYDSCVNLCGATRSVFLRVHHECTMYPSTDGGVVQDFVTSFETAKHALDALMVDVPLGAPEKSHLLGMVSNIDYRIRMLRELSHQGEPIRARLSNVDRLAEEMMRNQKSLREKAPLER